MVNIVKKIKLTIIGDEETRKEKYKWIRDEQYNQYRGLNMGMTYLAVSNLLYMNESGLEIRINRALEKASNTIEKSEKEIGRLKLRLEKEQKKKKVSEANIKKISDKIEAENVKISDANNEIEKLKESLVEATKQRMDIEKEFKEKYIDELYTVLDKIPFQCKDQKSLITQKIKKDMAADKSNGLLRGERSTRNYKRTFPLMVRGRDLTFSYAENGKDIEVRMRKEIRFKCILGSKIKNSAELRHTLHKVIKNEYKVCDSNFKFEGKKLILNLTLDIDEKENTDKVEGRVVGVDLGLKIPAYCALNDVSYIKKSIGSIDDFLRVRTQMQKRRRGVNKYLKSAVGGKGRAKKLKALDRFSEAEKNFAKTYNHFLSKNIIKFAVDNKAEQINLELLRMAETQDKSLLRNWSYYQLQQFIEYKAKREGIHVAYIDPYHTSQMCSKCNHFEKGQRESQAIFKCKSCGFEANADYNAARNIAKSTKYITKKEESEFHKNQNNDKMDEE